MVAAMAATMTKMMEVRGLAGGGAALGGVEAGAELGAVVLI